MRLLLVLNIVALVIDSNLQQTIDTRREQEKEQHHQEDGVYSYYKE